MLGKAFYTDRQNPVGLNVWMTGLRVNTRSRRVKSLRHWYMIGVRVRLDLRR